MVEPKTCGSCGGGLERYRKKWCAACALERKRALARAQYHREKVTEEYKARKRSRDRRRWAQSAEYRARKNANAARWRKNNREKTRVWEKSSEHRRRAQKQGGDATSSDIRALVVNAKRCAICRRVLNGEVHVDHIIPLAAGGRHTITNLRATCPSCNLHRPHDGSDVAQLVIA